MTRIRRMNMIIGALGTVALLICTWYFSLSFRDFLLLIVALSIVEGVAMHLYRKHRLRKPKPTAQS
jgi:hypothetical protein